MIAAWLVVAGTVAGLVGPVAGPAEPVVGLAEPVVGLAEPVVGGCGLVAQANAISEHAMAHLMRA